MINLKSFAIACKQYCSRTINHQEREQLEGFINNCKNMKFILAIVDKSETIFIAFCCILREGLLTQVYDPLLSLDVEPEMMPRQDLIVYQLEDYWSILQKLLTMLVKFEPSKHFIQLQNGVLCASVLMKRIIQLSQFLEKSKSQFILEKILALMKGSSLIKLFYLDIMAHKIMFFTSKDFMTLKNTEVKSSPNIKIQNNSLIKIDQLLECILSGLAIGYSHEVQYLLQILQFLVGDLIVRQRYCQENNEQNNIRTFKYMQRIQQIVLQDAMGNLKNSFDQRKKFFRIISQFWIGKDQSMSCLAIYNKISLKNKTINPKQLLIYWNDCSGLLKSIQSPEIFQFFCTILCPDVDQIHSDLLRNNEKFMQFLSYGKCARVFYNFLQNLFRDHKSRLSLKKINLAPLLIFDSFSEMMKRLTQINSQEMDQQFVVCLRYFTYITVESSQTPELISLPFSLKKRLGQIEVFKLVDTYFELIYFVPNIIDLLDYCYETPKFLPVWLEQIDNRNLASEINFIEILNVMKFRHFQETDLLLELEKRSEKHCQNISNVIEWRKQ